MGCYHSSFCWLGHSKMSFYYPHPMNRAGGNILLVGRTHIVGKGGLYSRMSFIYKYKMSRGFIKGVSGGCFILIHKWCYPQSAFTQNPGPTFLLHYSINDLWYESLTHFKLNRVRSEYKLKTRGLCIVSCYGPSGGGGHEVSVLTFYSNDLSSNPAEAYNFLFKID